MKKRMIPRLFIVFIIGMMCVASLAACSSAPPKLDTVYDQLVEKIDRAVDVNTVLFGAGLPVYDRDGAEEALLYRYYNAVDENAEYVMTDHARYISPEEIEAAVREVYATSYADSILTPLLTGDAIASAGLVVPATYRMEGNYFLQKKDLEPTVPGTRLYDYGSMRILPAESTATYIKVAIRSRTDEVGSAWKETRLSFSLEDGEWKLAGPSC